MATVPLAGQLIRASDFFTFTTFTPTWAGVTVGTSAFNEGWYQTLGNVVFWGFRLEFGTSPAFTSSALMTLPVTPYTGGGTGLSGAIGQWGVRSSGTVNYAGTVFINDSGGVQCKFVGAWNGTAPSANVGVSSSTPVTPAAGLVFSASGVYRAA